MKKQLFLTAFGSLMLIAGTFAQTVVLTNSFEEWDNNKPVGWNGSKTWQGPELVITQITTGTVYGSSAVELQVPASSHRRFCSAPVSIESGVEYQFRYYVKGKGDIRVGLYDDDTQSDDSGYEYERGGTFYNQLNSSDWVELTGAIIANRTTSAAQFIFSVRNTDPAAGHIQIDSVVVTSQEADAVSIYEIQYVDGSGDASPLAGTAVYTGGIVTGVETGFGYFLQAGTGPWSGIYVFQPSANVAIGDSLTLSATVEERFGNTQLTSVSGLVKVSSGNPLPAAVVASTGTLASEAYEGVLVRAEDAPATGTPHPVFGTWPINDGSGQLLVDTLLYRYTEVVVNDYVRYSVQGPIIYSFSSFRILPRTASDVEQVTGMEKRETLSGLTVFPNPSTGLFRLSLHAETGGQGMLRMMDVAGKLVYEQPVTLTAGSNEISIADVTASGGMYQLQLTVGEQTATRRLVIE